MKNKKKLGSFFGFCKALTWILLLQKEKKLNQISISEAFESPFSNQVKNRNVLFGGIFVSNAHLIFDYQTSIFLQAKQPGGMIKWQHQLTVDLLCGR